MFEEEADIVDEFILSCEWNRDDDIRRGYELLERYPRNAYLWRMCGNLIEMSRSRSFQIDEARYCYEQTIELRPDHFQGYEDLGDWYSCRCADFQTAIRYYRRAFELGNEDSSRIELARALAHTGRKTEALSELEQCRDRNSTDYSEARQDILEGLLDPSPHNAG